jgi:SNF2 family DNA or RNA helicase
VITIEVTHRQTHLAKMVPGARYHARPDDHLDRPHFTYPLSWGSCKALRGVFTTELAVDPSLATWAKAELETRIQPSLDLRDMLELPSGLGAEALQYGMDERLRPYQEVAAMWLPVAKCAILADEMRVGKTPESCQAGMLLGELALPALVVAPNSVKFQWEEAIHDWWPDARPVIIRGAAGQRRKAIDELTDGRADIGIINWEALRLHSRVSGYASVVALARCEQHGGDGSVPITRCEAHPRELNAIDWKLVIADEAHRAVHPRAKQTRALWAVAEDAEYRWALTGTPVLDSPEDLWALGRWIAPEDFPTKTAFLERYGLLGWNPFGGLEVIGLRTDTKDELFSFVDPRFLRRTRKMVMQWLPEKIPVTRTVEMGAKQARAYKEMKEEMLTELDDGSQTFVTNSLAKLTRLRQFASAYARIDEEGNLVLTSPSNKVEAMLEVAEELGGKPAAVFAESKQLINLAGAALVKAGYTVGYVTGDVTDVDRDTFVQEFQRGDIQFLLVTLGAGGEGLTLDRADVAVFLQRSFSLAKNSQAEDRIVGQTSGPGLEIIDIITVDSIEQRVLEVLADKAQITEEIVRDRETFARLLSDEAWVESELEATLT